MSILENMKKMHDVKKQKSCMEELMNSSDVIKKISLRKEMVINEVKKQKISCEVARIVFVLDHSGSMKNMYNDGSVQNLLEKIFPIAMHFDDNSEMEFYWFDNSFKELAPVTPENIDGYVKNVILAEKEHFGTTCYAPIMNEIINRYTVTAPSDIPTFVIFITDGANSDKKDAKNALIAASKHNIFWKYIGIGNEKFEFLERLDDLKNRFIDNANFVPVNDINSISESDLYTLILEEYNQWLGLCRENGISVESR